MILRVAVAAVLFTIAWDAPESGPVDRYRIYRASEPAGLYTLLRTVTTTSARVEVPVGGVRCYRVRAVDELGQASPFSNRVCLGATTETGD